MPGTMERVPSAVFYMLNIREKQKNEKFLRYVT